MLGLRILCICVSKGLHTSYSQSLQKPIENSYSYEWLSEYSIDIQTYNKIVDIIPVPLSPR